MNSPFASGCDKSRTKRVPLSRFRKTARHLRQASHLVWVLLLVSCFDPQGGWHRGNVVSEERDIDPFTDIVTRDGWDLVLQQGTEYKMTVEAEEGLMDHLVTGVRDGVLDIRSDHEAVNVGVSRIYLTFRDLNSVKASGGSDVFF